MRRRIHNHVEGMLLAAQHPNGYLYYDYGKERFKFHTNCVKWEGVKNAVEDGVRLYLIDTPIYAPDQCCTCKKRNLRVRNVRG